MLFPRENPGTVLNCSIRDRSLWFFPPFSLFFKKPQVKRATHIYKRAALELHQMAVEPAGTLSGGEGLTDTADTPLHSLPSNPPTLKLVGSAVSVCGVHAV